MIGIKSRQIALVALAVFVCAACGTSNSGDEASTGYVTTDDGVELYYRVSGRGADTLVVLHGGPGLSSAYLAPDLDLLEDDFTLIHYDQRGSGRSTVVTDSSMLRLANHVADVEAVRRHFGVSQAAILGHSWGAVPAAFHAAAYPEHTRELLIVDPMPLRRKPYMQQFGDNLRAWMDSTTLARVGELSAARRESSDPVGACAEYWTLFIRGYFSNPADPGIASGMRGNVCDMPPDALANGGRVYASVVATEGDWDWRGRLSGVAAPMLVVAGASGPMPAESSAEWATTFPNAELVTIEGSGHFPHVERPEAFLDAVRSFMRRERNGTGLAGTRWRLEDLSGRGVIDNTQATLNFDEDGSVSGNASCNALTGGAEVRGGSVTFGELATTRKMCVPALMDQEVRYLAALQGTRRFRVEEPFLYVLIPGSEPLRFIRVD